MRKTIILALVALALGSFGAAQAAGELDVSTPDSFGQIGVAWFYYNDPDSSTGTGTFEPFLSLDNHTYTIWEFGYNYDYDHASPALRDEITGGDRTHSLLLSDVPIVYLDGDPTAYREFRIDVNQEANDPLTLDTFRIYQSTDPFYVPLPGSPPTAAIYDMDTSGDNWVQMSGQKGSGSGDMRVLLPSDLFTETYVTLYSEMGDVPDGDATNPLVSNDGFEEWGVITAEQPVIPEASSVVLALSSLPSLGMLGWLRRRKLSS